MRAILKGQDTNAIVHLSALCESQAVGRGTRIWAFAHVMEGAVVGSECNIGEHVFVEAGARVGNRVTIKNGVSVWNGVTLGDDVFVGPAAIFTNDKFPRSPRSLIAKNRYAHQENWLETTTVSKGATIGAGAIIMPGLTIGAYAFIAAGAVVTKNALEFATLAGNPARQIGWSCMCGQPIENANGCRSCGRIYTMSAGCLKPCEQPHV